MEIQVFDEQKILEVWLTRAEQSDPEIQAQLKPMYAAYKKKGYTSAVFLSGDRDLQEQTSALLCFNQKRSAQMNSQQ